MLVYNVFGRHLGVQRENDRWLVFRADLTDDMTEGEIAGWLSDIFHEASTERHPNVERIE